MLLKETEKKEIEAKIHDAEKKTSGEIVVFLAQKSADYRWLCWPAALFGGCLAALLSYIVTHRTGFPLSLVEMALCQVVGMLVGAFLASLKSVQRLSARFVNSADSTHHKAFSKFVLTGMSQTRDRTGILIFLSEWERRAVILADAGIHKHTEPGYWDAQVALIVKGLREGRPTEGISRAVEQMGEKLAQYFPPRADDKNELSNHVLGEV